MKSSVVNCQDQYYLALGDRNVWLTGTGVLSGYSYSEVEVSGSDSPKDNPCLKPDARYCGCEDYLVIDEIKVITEGKALAQEYFGEVVCVVEGENEDGSKWCAHGLKIENFEKPYLLAPLSGSANLSDFIGARVRVLGMLNNNKFDVFEISRVE